MNDRKSNFKKFNYDISNKLISKTNKSFVFEAINKTSGVTEVVKIIPKTSLNNIDKNNIVKEITIMKKMQNKKHIVNINAIAETKELCLIFMNKIDGFDFRQILESLSTLNENLTRMFFKEMLVSIETCHNNGIVHRDIKLDNFMLQVNNDGEKSVVLIDFGLSDYVYANENIKKEYKIHKQFCGSPQYAAPELCLKKPYHGKPVDVWSLGITLYCMVEGKFPFYSNDDNKTKLYENIVNNKLTFQKSSVELQKLLELMLKKNPLQRITTTEIKNQPWYNQK